MARNRPDTGQPVLTTINGRLTITHPLLDADLFTRLTRHAQHPHAAGDATGALDDYRQALALVCGQAFGGDTGPGYNWPVNPEQLEDRTPPGVISDAAHAATTRDRPGRPRRRTAAAHAGGSPTPTPTTPLCDLLHFATLSGDRNQAVRWAQALLLLNDADTPADLPEPAQKTLQAAFPHGVPGT